MLLFFLLPEPANRCGNTSIINRSIDFFLYRYYHKDIIVLQEKLMKTLSIKISESLLAKLDAIAQKRGETRSLILREALESALSKENQIQNGSCLELARDLAGSINGQEDLSFNNEHMNGYGQ